MSKVLEDFHPRTLMMMSVAAGILGGAGVVAAIEMPTGGPAPAAAASPKESTPAPPAVAREPAAREPGNAAKEPPTEKETPTEAPGPGPGEAGKAAAAECDRLAGDPDDPQKQGEGVAFDKIELEKAADSCARAVEADNQNPRLLYQLGRTLAALGKTSEALTFLEIAAGSNYPAATKLMKELQAQAQGAPAETAPDPKQGTEPAAGESLGDLEFKEPEIIAHLNTGNIKALNKEVAQSFNHVRHMNLVFQHWCPALYDPALTRRVSEVLLGTGLEDLVKLGKKVIGDGSRGPGGVVQNFETILLDGEEIMENAKKDAATLIEAYRCQGATKRIYKNMTIFVAQLDR